MDDIRIKVEHLGEPFGIGVSTPRLSWTVDTGREGWRQTAYEIEVHREDGGDERVWVRSGESVLVPWPFTPLTSRERVTVRVRVTDRDGDPSPWSRACHIEAGLLTPEDWSARFVAGGQTVRKEFRVASGLVRARLYASALGVYEAEINGTRVGDHVLAPGWTSYAHRLRYQTFDVTHLLSEGPAAIGAILGDGWHLGRLGFGGGRRHIYGDRRAFLAQLELFYQDGTAERVVTDDTWPAAGGPIVSSGIYEGEVHDARLERPGWSEPKAPPDQDQHPIEVINRDLSVLTAPTGPPIRRTELHPPTATLTSPSGKKILDFGQNLVGRLRVTASGNPGERVVLKHAEALENGDLCTRPLRTADSTDVYILRGGDEETWEPRFTFHGFRYASIEGPVTEAVAVVCHTDLERSGWFECSDPLLNRLHENIVWSTRGNFLDVPTDCPQRDERLGWTGDLQVFAPTATFLYGTAGMLTSWLADLMSEQAEDGAVPLIAPNVLGDVAYIPVAGWSDAAVVVPWTLYERYGDADILRTHFDGMRRFVDHVAAHAGPDRLWNSGFQIGDWLHPAAPPDRPHESGTPPELVATAYFARSAALVAAAADVLGREASRERYEALAAEVREAFRAEYTTGNGRLLSDSPTAYALALRFDLLTPGQRAPAARRLAALVRAGGHAVPTGFLGTPLICDALAENGHLDDAYRLLMRRECPSWLYPVTMGATTVWERWDALLSDGSVNPGGMTSFNHYAFGAVADWMHRTVAGLAPAAPGYRTLAVAPRPGGGLTWARARLRTPYGTAESAWSIEDGHLTLEVEVPPNTTALIDLPGGERAEVGAGRHRRRVPYAPVEEPPTLDSTLDRLDGDVKAAVVEAIARHQPDFAPFLPRALSGGMTVRRAVEAVRGGEDMLAAVAAAISSPQRH
ncbi:glycoside hydrolase family 78 protein [Sinosporangium siamense]|uniref:alpha-L-rhamnosidase n=1 Tax=Sinosporangium siamense TaxID=1367973 RepID=A0A919RFJ5_9ACTN|nr:glycoside hydrolase family 78 protein [Sinosporangium siamense]GII92457.1 alpha-L-rhamnosidase [Sinosporangium siamense]